MSHVLIVEDDPDTARLLADLIRGENFSVTTAGSLQEARSELRTRVPDLVFLDLVLPDGSGMGVFDPPTHLANTEVVLVTGHASVETIVQALRVGAADCLIKPVSGAQVKALLQRYMRPDALQAELGHLEQAWAETGRFGPLWGRSPAMQVVYEQIQKVAQSSVSVFITGESGTGKELVAQSVHALSRRRAGPFLAVNCGAISANLIESELFGHEKGSFTGAHALHRGYFERASGGTLFLDELTEMPMELQVKLLRVLETGNFMRVGSTQSMQADVRIVAATNRIPQRAVDLGRLREDLMYRLNVFPIALPPLRDRRDDIPLLAEHFVRDIGDKEGKSKRFSAAALQALQSADWPGNVRELRNVVQRAFVMTDGDLITAQWMPRSNTPAPLIAAAPKGALVIPFGTPLAEVQRLAILGTLAHCGGSRARTAAALGVSVKTLYNRLQAYAGALRSADSRGGAGTGKED